MQTDGRGRIVELDFLKGVLILLMISFHLVWFGDSHPYAKQVVYTFHMPGFLMISGYLMNVEKPWRQFLKTLLSYAVPYLVMESGYIVMASVLPIREHIDELTIGVFLEKLFLHPLGPYWYLLTLLVCGALYAAVFSHTWGRFFFVRAFEADSFSHKKESSPGVRVILLGILYFAIAKGVGMITFACALYFLAGVVIRRSGLGFTDVFKASFLAIVAFALLAWFPENCRMDVVGGVLMVYLAISGLLWAFQYARAWVKDGLLYLGKRTLPLFLFSPLFTFLCKPLVPYLDFDPTCLLFLVISLAICVSGSLMVDWVIRKTGLSRWFYIV